MIFTDFWTLREGVRKNPEGDERVIVLENATKSPEERLIFTPDDALWVGKELTKLAKKVRKKGK